MSTTTRSHPVALRHPLRLLLGLLLVITAAVASPVPRAEAAGPEVVAVRQVGERLVDLIVRSPALGGREVPVRLLTPKGWSPGSGSRRSWPTLWLLHGCCGDYTAWSSVTDIEEFGELEDVLVVMPEAGWNGWYSDWWDFGRPSDQQWETFHLTELRRLLERDWGAGPRRVVAGPSMGGQGALLYAARHPGLFSAAAAYSGSVHPLRSPESIARLQGFFSYQGDDPDRVWGDPVGQRAIWEAHDPVNLAPALTSIPVYLSCGDGTPGPYDPPGTTDALEADFAAQNEALAAELRRLGAPHLTTNFYGPGQHRWDYWERELRASLPMLRDALRLDR